MINFNKCTTVWYVDVNKPSQVYHTMVTYLIEHIRTDFGDLFITRGKINTFLGMNITIHDDKNIDIDMCRALRSRALIG